MPIDTDASDTFARLALALESCMMQGRDSAPRTCPTHLVQVAVRELLEYADIVSSGAPGVTPVAAGDVRDVLAYLANEQVPA